jgi:hypothetical protein
MKYRIISEDGRIYVESKWLLFWSKEREEIGWGCDIDKVFGSVGQAEDYINKIAKPTEFEVIKVIKK